ncbi:diacylglycerol/lipid kinase family protein [Gordonia sp. CPCC 205333]|uniref:diacylglycerol/lipid kinase family protein n=1 Tax=Gordonia sp. CPCC 205333 TaxID=3140790 RepID=UPI003AF35A36
MPDDRTGSATESVSGLRRVSAVLALSSGAVLASMLVIFLFRSGLAVVTALVGVAVGVAGAWWVVTERIPRRAVGAAAVLGGLAIIGFALVGVDWVVPRLAGAAALLMLFIGCARFALVRDLHSLDRSRLPKPPTLPVLLCNPKSGDGKVERFGIVDAAQQLGVRTVVLGADDDLEKLARDAVAGGADCLGMAGGDGSQALVAAVAVEHDIPFVCISAGTRNHFALDLGLDRSDPGTTLRAFVDAVERRVDYATVNGRLFVNNVSLGVYATVVQHDSYRSEKIHTAAEVLPNLLGPLAEPFDLQFDTPTGDHVDGAFVILVSNNPYTSTATLDAGTRSEMDTGTLGVVAVSTSTGAQAARLMTRSAVGLRRSSPFWHEFAAQSFSVTTQSGRALAGVDGEALDLPAPLHFRSHPRGLRLLVPAGNERIAASRRARNISAVALLDVARGRSR